MQKEIAPMRADVKCYYCGHISGQIVGYRHQPVNASSFVPRPGYTGPAAVTGQRLRCERCGGPVFLEEVGSDEVTRKPDQLRPTRGRPSTRAA